MVNPMRGRSSGSRERRMFYWIIIGTILLALFLINVGSWSVKAVDESPVTLDTTKPVLTQPNKWLGYDVSLNSPAPVPIRGVKTDQSLLEKREKLGYQGKGEPEHVGGFLKNDSNSFEPQLWTWMINILGVSSLIDVGCGVGVSSKWFLDNGVNVTCVEGSPSGVRDSLVPEIVVEHDYSKGPWWDSNMTYDAAWSCEFLEHIDVDCVANYMATFSRARLVFASHAIWGGWHHVAIRETWWWVQLFKDYGFEYMPQLTDLSRKVISKSGMSYFRHQGMVFRNLRFSWKTDFEMVYFAGKKDWKNFGIQPGRAGK